ncbi:MAG: MoaD/ThiS family protein [Phycisphaerales bacterium]|nr:MoaD/ThiS family protein [Phycisphaerales bacterium]
MPRILIPTPLRPYVEHQPAVEVEGATVGEALEDLVRRHAAVARHLLDETGAIRSFVNVYVNDEDIRHLQRTETSLAGTDTISIVPSVAGGREVR